MGEIVRYTYRLRKRCAAGLAKAQRRMARRRRLRGQAQSAGYRRAKRETARIQKKAARQNEAVLAPTI